MKPAVSDARFRVFCLRIVPKVGSPIYLTHHPKDLFFGGHTYITTNGYDFSGFSSQSDMAPPVVDLDGIANIAGISSDAIASGVFDGARCYLFATTWVSPIEDEEPLLASLFGKTTLMDNRYRIEDMGLIDALNQVIGKTYTASCTKTFGGQEYAGCKFNLASVTVSGYLSAVADASNFTDSSLAQAADYFGGGTIVFLTGPNAGLKAIEVKSFAAGGIIQTFEPFFYLPVVGNQYTLIPGCRKRRLEDCYTKWNNVINFGGFEHIPLGSTYAQIGSSS